MLISNAFPRVLPLAVATLLTACSSSSNSPETAPQIEHLSGGETSINDTGTDIFSQKSRNMTSSNRIIAFNEGNHFFEAPWVQGTQSTQARDGLGPYFNNSACQGCHIKDGRGHAGNTATLDGTTRSDDFNSLLIRVSTTAEPAANQANVPDSNVGGQLQHKAILGVQAEATQEVSYTSKTVTFSDGHQVELRVPSWHLTSTNGAMSFDSDSIFSARVAPQMIGLGLLELIPEADILAREDIDDSDSDGISGKANRVYSLEHQAMRMGRFGWKAGQPSLIEQTAGAFLGDMGLTSELHPNENCHNMQTDCLNAPNGNGTNSDPDEAFEVTPSTLQLVAFYSKHLSVPQRRNAYDEQVQRGKALFNQSGCEACHRASYVTGFDEFQPELNEQTIFPYTDMLLHDMGQDLADFTADNTPANGEQKVEFLATANEWRTAPLWGIGRAQEVDPNATFLHDGRARTIMEAVLWHGGEAEAAKQKVLEFSQQQRQDFMAFLNDL